MGPVESSFSAVDIIQTVGIIASIAISVLVIIRGKRANQAANYFALVQKHRELWTLPLQHEALSRVRDEQVDLRINPISVEERQFVLFVLLHASSAFELQRFGELAPIQAFSADLRSFCSLPIPNTVWRHSKRFFGDRFVALVDGNGDEFSVAFR